MALCFMLHCKWCLLVYFESTEVLSEEAQKRGTSVNETNLKKESNKIRTAVKRETKTIKKNQCNEKLFLWKD